jgi:NitT/TauT family transport system permease protein
MIRLAQIGVFVGFAILWEIAARTFADPFYISSPSLLAVVLVKDLASTSFYKDLWVTFVELFGGYATGAIGGVATAILFGRWPTMARVFDPFLVALNSIPRIALAPLFVIWFGIDLASKVVLAATLVYFLTFFNTLAGIRAIEPRFINVARVVGASEWEIFRLVVLPGATAWIMTGLRTSLPFALIGVIVGEFIAASSGLGFRLNFYATSYNAAGTMAMLIVMMAIMMALNNSMVWLEEHLLRWRPEAGTGNGGH